MESEIYFRRIQSHLLPLVGTLTPEIVKEFVLEELQGNSVRIGLNNFEISESLKNKVVEYALRDLNLLQSDHVRIRGGGLYIDDKESELNKETWAYYLKHRAFISRHIFTNEFDIVESIDYETDQIIKRVPNPFETEKFLFKGLVVGYVQSGKTANFTHLISKAASIGYRFVVVLAGMTNTLRLQTQFRLDQELTGNKNYETDLEFVQWSPSENKYVCLTTSKKGGNRDGDFGIPVADFNSHFNSTNDVTIIVIKKLANRKPNSLSGFGSVIGRVLNWVKASGALEQMPPLFMIDDEADQASIDTSGPEDDVEPTVINHAIRTFLSYFDKACYVGYTATPFANVFIDKDGDFDGLPDLYPSNLIHSLPEPKGYFGAKQFFGDRWEDGSGNSEFNYIEILPEEERGNINSADEEITIGLKNALKYYAFSHVLKGQRKKGQFSSMLIHTDHRNIYHQNVVFKVRNYIDILNALIADKNKCSILYEEFNEFLKEIKVKQYKIGFTYPIEQCDLHEFILGINNFIDSLKIKVINSFSDTLDYSSEDLSNLICIGGNVMSRGVTLKGLTVTYYLRESPKYDTLLQMGRWFGYRNGYEDLMRVYTTQTIAEYYEYLMKVEDDLRKEIYRYQEERLEPIDFAPRVRAHLKMLPSSKMGSSTLTRSYSRQTAQTIYFDRSLNTIEYNNLITSQLFNQCDSFDFHEGSITSRNVGINILVDFLRNYRFPKFGFDFSDLIRYVESRIDIGELKLFDVKFSGRINKRQNSESDVYGDFEIFPVMRNVRKGSGLKNINQDIVNIGVISDANDIPESLDGKNPLLLIYAIDRMNSDAFNSVFIDSLGNTKLSDNKLEDLEINPKGFALVLPSSEIRDGEINYYQQIFQ